MPPADHRARAVPVLVLAVLVMSWAAPLIRLSTAPPVAIAAWRLTIASLLLLPFFARPAERSQWREIGRRGIWAAIGAGIALAVHFASWITSLRLTSVAASSVLVALAPVFAWLLSRSALGERPSNRQALGIVLAVIGAVIIAAGDARSASRGALLGDALALLGAACGAIYFVVGRSLRARLSLAAYVTPVYGIAAIILLAWAGLRGEAFAPYAPREWAIFAALALGPMILGHTGLNFALRYFPAYVVGVAALGEPVGSTVLAWVLPSIGERPGIAAVLGGAMCVGGIAVTLISPRPSAHSPQPH